MKKQFFLLALILIHFAAVAQDNYFVTVIKGKVTMANGTKIVTGAKLNLADKVIFESKDGLLILLHPAKGRIIISPATATVTTGNKLIVWVKDCVNLNSEIVRLSSRGMGDDLPGLEEYFTTNQKFNNRILVIDTLKVKLIEPVYANADNRENFFFLQLVAEKPVNHKLKVVNKQLVITGSDLVFNDSLYSKTIGVLNLGYIQNYSSGKEIKLVAEIEPVFMTKEVCTSIISNIKASFKGHKDTDIIDEIYTQLYYSYGKPDMEIIRQLYFSASPRK